MNEAILTVAIPTFNNEQVLTHCLVSLTRYVEFPMQILVVNNGAAHDPDGVGFEEKLRTHVPYRNLRIVQADKNLGWQGGINRAFAEASDTELFCMCNDDVLFLPWNSTFFRSLCRYFQDPSVGAVGPSSNYVMGSQSLFDHRGPGVFEATLLIGFCMVTRSSLFAEIGGLDEGLIGGDDLDYSILVRKAGYKLLVDKTAYLHHIGSLTGPRVEDRVVWNSQDHQDMTNNALIRKHGVQAWYDCIQSKISVFEPITQNNDFEGDALRAMVDGLSIGVDVGCGANKTVARAVGIDRDAKGTAGLYGGRKNDDSVADLQGEATALPCNDASQDFVVARHILEHIVDPLAALAEWRRVLRPGGVLAIACPDEDACHTILLDASHVHAYTVASLSRLLELAGFTVHSSDQIRPGISFVIKATKPVAVSAAGIAVSMQRRPPFISKSLEAFYFA